MFALRFEYSDGVGLFALGTASLKPQHLRTMTLITQHKPIERASDMVFMTKTISNSSLAERSLHGNPVWAAHDFKDVHARRRPGVPAPMMIKRNPILHILAPPLVQRTIRRSCISKSKPDLVAHNSGSWGVRLLHDVLAAVFPLKIIIDLWIGGSSAIQFAVIS